MDLIKRINKKNGLIFDGAMGTMLIAKGLEKGRPSEIFNLENPDAVYEIHLEYIKAGSDVITTNTFGGSGLKLSKTELNGKTEEINRIAVRVARRAADGSVIVAGDIGPTGEMLKPYGVLEPEAAVDIFAEQAYYLDSEGVDAFIVETMFDINEMITALKGVRKVSDKPIFATLTFVKKPVGFFTLMGNDIPNSMRRMLDEGADIVGANCSIGSDAMVDLAAQIRKSVDSPVIVQPNAGVPKIIDEEVVYPESKEFFAENIIKIKTLGVEVVGGCCGTSPEYIDIISKRLKRKF
ncbi:MAG: homocysteine S-methyltransferase family protein [Candidatus Marinimicrobia bacterium]|nr:homocysteine S-methyltransferase family protein [Candidatus Neomarinimicrobiota bacterium]